MLVQDVLQEFSGCHFGDQRLTKRLPKMLNTLLEKPNVSLPAAFNTKGELDAVYRFCNNPKTTPQKILQPHIEATYERIATENLVLLVQDTTEIDLTRPVQQVAGAGPMDSEARRGAFFHPLVAFNLDAVPLGIVGQKIWTREAISQQTPAEKSKTRRAKPIDQKESIRWLQGLRQADQAARACPQTTCVCVGDSESDIYELFVEHGHLATDNLQLLVRAGQSRNTVDKQDWFEPVRASETIAQQSVQVRARTAKIGTGRSARSRSREARVATLQIRKATIQVARPVHGQSDLPGSVSVNVVLCEETDPPAGEDPICWMLVTTLAIDTDAEVQRIIRAYCIRWQIEVYFRTLKSGCRIERRQFEQIDRVKTALALFSVVAWRLMYLVHMGRECPELDCETMFEPSEWRSVYAILGKEIPESGTPSLNEVIGAIASLGGFVDRPSQEPGTQTLWVGLQRCHDLSNAWNTFGPGAKNFCPD